MKHPLAASAIALAIFAAFAAPNAAVAAETIGAPVIDRPINDTALGSIFALNSGFTQPGVLTSFSYFNNDLPMAGLAITPLLFSVSGGNYTITGVGAPGVNNGMGAQTFAFVLTSGSAAVGPGTLFGWKDGTVTDQQVGIIDLSFNAAPVAGTQQYFGAGTAGGASGYIGFPVAGTNLGAGRTLDASFGQARDYSIQATAVPEPATMTLACLGGLFLVGMRLRGERASRNTAG